jgi:hypothetical protein
MKPQRDENGTLPAYAWPGGYPLYYLCGDNGILCPECANKESAVREGDEHPDYPDYDQWRIVAADVNWEDSSLTCDNCSKGIESAYAEQGRRCRVNPASTNTNNMDGLRAVCEPSVTLPDLCHHAMYEIYVDGQYVESVGNLGANAERALAFYQRKRRRQTVGIRIQPCRLPGCTWRQS